jgi:hypothetical protein
VVIPKLKHFFPPLVAVAGLILVSSVGTTAVSLVHLVAAAAQVLVLVVTVVLVLVVAAQPNVVVCMLWAMQVLAGVPPLISVMEKLNQENQGKVLPL